jgi:hypothetical protein
MTDHQPQLRELRQRLVFRIDLPLRFARRHRSSSESSAPAASAAALILVGADGIEPPTASV